MVIWSPLSVLKLTYQFWLEPAAVLHLFSCKTKPPATGSFLREVRERTIRMCRFQSPCCPRLALIFAPARTSLCATFAPATTLHSLPPRNTEECCSSCYTLCASRQSC